MSITSKSFQQQRFKKVVNLAGLRYETSVNVRLPIRSLLHALIKSEQFCDEIAAEAHKLLETSQYIGRDPFYSFAKAEYDSIKKTKAQLVRHMLKVIENDISTNIRKSSISDKSKALRDSAYAVIDKLNKAEEEKKLKLPKNASTSLQGEKNELYQLAHQASLIDSYFSGNNFTAFTKASLMMKGEAGIGKTHLFCDFAKEALELGHPVYIFLGEEFAASKDPLACISDLLNGDKRYARLLQQIDNEAKKRNKKAVVLVDAVNEAKTKVDWTKMNGLKKYKNISFAISIRTGYEKAILEDEFVRTVQTYNHPGLDVGDFNDVSKFFTHYSVPLPDVPLIAPEFRNPLFIKIFCKTYTRTRTVRGHVGATTLFEDYVKKQTKQVLRTVGEPQNRDHIWKKIIKPFAEWMGENGTARILETKARQLVEVHYPGKSKQILQEMQRYWLLSKTPHYSKSGKLSGYEYRFPYQKFSDHLIARYLLDRNLDKLHPQQSFLPKSKLGAILDKSYSHYDMRYGLIEAMAIQVPERLNGKDLVNVAPEDFKETYIAVETFLNSLMWRSLEMEGGALKCFNRQEILDYINNHVINTDDGFDKTLNTMLNVACIEAHPLDAETLHNFFLKHKMPKRDAFWQRFMHYYNDDGSVIERYLTWASSPLSRKIRSEKVVEQTAVAMSWFLASSNRRVRDKTTKALVNLLDGKYSVIVNLLKRFHEVDDVYIIERIYAIAYGCALRETDVSKIGRLATHVYETEFSSNTPFAHILIRDYARGIVELYHNFKPSAPFDKNKYLPPYKSTFPRRVPSEKTLEKKYRHSDDVKKDYYSVWGSVMYPHGLGDFGNYVVNSNLSRFSRKKRDGSTPKSEKELVDEAVGSLKPAHKALLETIHSKYRDLNWKGILGDEKHLEEARKDVDKSFEQLKKTLKGYSKQQLELIDKYARSVNLDDNSRFDTGLAQRWIFNRVISLGWDPKLHGSYDKEIRSYDRGRAPNKPERIGKKYQWQALHEFLALAADSFYMNKGEGEYEGPWQLSIRDIDPSYTITKTLADDKGGWWFKVPYDDWRTDVDDVTWMKNESDLPDLKQLIEVKDRRGKKWLDLEAFFHWKQPLLHIPEDKRYSYKHREVWVMIHSYIVKKADLTKFIEWGKNQHFMGDWMPKSHEFYGAFYREFPGQRGFMHMYTPYYGKQDWYPKSYGRNNLPVKLMVTDDEYSQEGSGYDQSIDEGFGIKLPAKPIYDSMKVRSASTEGQYKNDSGQIVFLDPHVKEKGPRALLASTSHFTEYLNDKDYAVVWTVLGQKQTIGDSMGRDRDWPGIFEFSGVYYFDQDTQSLQGDIYTKKFITKGDER